MFRHYILNGLCRDHCSFLLNKSPIHHVKIDRVEFVSPKRLEGFFWGIFRTNSWELNLLRNKFFETYFFELNVRILIIIIIIISGFYSLTNVAVLLRSD